MFDDLTDSQREALIDIVGSWINEGIATPPYEEAEYDIFEALGLDRVDDRWLQYNTKRPH